MAIRGSSVLGVTVPPNNGGKPSNRYTANTFQNPTGTTSATKVMMGLGSTWTNTPSSTGKVRVTIVGWLTNSSSSSIAQLLNVNYGTGTAPTNGAALTGTALLASDYTIGSSSAANIQVPFTFVAEVSGLTLSTAYWFDAAIASNGVATASLRVVYTIIEEF